MPNEPDGVKRCTRCFGRDVRPSQSRGTVDKIMKMLGRKPYRCRGCSHRFYVFIPRVKDELDEDVEAASGDIESTRQPAGESKDGEDVSSGAAKPAAP